MKGLFLKDCYLFIKRCLNIIVLIAFAVIMSLVFPDISLFIYYSAVIISMIPMTLLAYDEKDKWNQYATTMPYSKKDIVVEKYLFGLILSAVMIVLTVGMKITVDAVKNQFEIMRYIELTMSLISICLIAPSVMLPFVFKYGVEKGRIAYYIIIGAVCAIIAGMSSIGGNFAISENIEKWFGLILMAGAVVVYIVSVLLSVKIFEKRKI